MIKLKNPNNIIFDRFKNPLNESDSIDYLNNNYRSFYMAVKTSNNLYFVVFNYRYVMKNEMVAVELTKKFISKGMPKEIRDSVFEDVKQQTLSEIKTLNRQTLPSHDPTNKQCYCLSH
ncbi:TPA: hypothetical protein ACQ2HY_003306 [Klebsiella pneumoniae]